MGCVIRLRMSGPGKSLEGYGAKRNDGNISRRASAIKYSDIIIIHCIAVCKSERDGHSVLIKSAVRVKLQIGRDI